MMKLIIEAEPNELAALVVALQERRVQTSTSDVVKENTEQLQNRQWFPFFFTGKE